MSFLGSMFSDANGAGFQAQGANIGNPVDLNQLNTAYGQTQNGLAQQQALLQALQGQNGIQNQSDVYNQLQGVANGQGPNPAQAMLANQTGQNVAQQNALMAGQRGSGANTGLLARQAAMQGANIQQQGVGQGAAMQAQQSLGALGQLGGIAGQQVGQQAQALTGYNQMAQNSQAQLLNALGQYQNAAVGMQGNINSVNGGIANTNAQGQQAMLGGILGGVGAGLGMAKAYGGMIEPKHFAAGGEASGPQSFAGKFLSGWSSNSAPASSPQSTPMSAMGNQNPGAQALNTGLTSFGRGLGSVLSSPSPAIPPSSSPLDFGKSTESPISGFQLNQPQMMSTESPVSGFQLKSGGGKVGGEAKVSGDSLKNDDVPAMLSPGEVVIPRSVMNSKDPAGGAAKFVQAVLSRKKK